MKLICGLGNPGREYEEHRHNVGFHVVDAIAHQARIDLSSEKFQARVGQGSFGGHKVLLVQPQTYMNHSGEAVGAAARFYKIPLEALLVVHDEIDLPFGRLQLKGGGGAGGHNGLRSLIQLLGTDAFARLRFGVGKPEGPHAKDRVVGHVLGNFSQAEQPELPALYERAVEAAAAWTAEGLGPAMNRFNRKG